MKCKCCNTDLSHQELDYRDDTGLPLDTCEDCLDSQGSAYIEDEFIEDLKDLGIEL